MKRFLFIVALAALAVSCKTPAIESAVVFAENSDSCHFYRIPAMILDAHLFYSKDEGQTWKDILTLQEGFAAYSTMVVFKNSDVGVLYEDGTNSPDGGYDIVFSRVPRRIIKESIKAAE